MKLKTRLFIMLSLVAVFFQQAQAANYCMAIRGNGELEPAHWGAVSQVVEKLGLPSAQAGGSSASITMFFLDGIATNHFVKDGEHQAPRAALLVKSLQGFLNQLTLTDEWKDFAALYGRVAELKQTSWVTNLKSLIDQASSLGPEGGRNLLQQNASLLQRNYQTGVKLGLISATSYAPLFVALQKLTSNTLNIKEFSLQLATAKFYASELEKTVSVFGSFNAETDSNLFFRPGIVDFDRLADQLGRVGEFYSLTHPEPGEDSMWAEFFASCTAKAQGETWQTLVAQYPTCAAQFGALMQLHLSANPGSNFALHPIGVSIPSFPSTAVLVGRAHQEALRAEVDYVNRRDTKFGDGFQLSDSEDVRFGYWGRSVELANVATHLSKSDEKSRRFFSLGQATWKVALGLSPAEPGLSPLKNFINQGVELTSAGGWSDLHPVQVLKATGLCDNVVYITRRGGESLFGQGVAKRLLGSNYNRDWKFISTSTSESRNASAKLNNLGDATSEEGLWNELYNLANPQSSFRVDLANADAVLCTDWDRFEITGGVQPMIDDAYASLFYISPTSHFSDFKPSRLDPAQMNAKGYPEYSGCF